MYNKVSLREEFAFEETKPTLFRSFIFPGIFFRVGVVDRFPRTGLLWFVFPWRTVTIRSHKSSAGIPSILKPSACVLRTPHQLLLAFETLAGAITFPPEADFFVESLSSGPSASRNTFSVSTITDGNARIGSRSSYLPLRWPDCTLSRLRAEEYDRPVTQSRATPEPSSRTIPTLDRTLVALNIDRFHQPCLLPGRTSRIGEDCRPRTRGGHLPFLGSPALPPLRLTGGFFATPTRRHHGRTLIHPSPPACATPDCTGDRTHAGSDPLESAAACFGHALGPPPPGHPKKWFLILLNCAKLKFVSYTSNRLEQTYASENAQRSTWCRFWILKISCKIGVLKQSQSALFRSVSHMTILFVFTCVMNVGDQTRQSFVTWSIQWLIVQVCSLTMEYRVFQHVPSISISEQFESTLLTILPRISILLLWNDGHECMELILSRVAESSCLPLTIPFHTFLGKTFHVIGPWRNTNILREW